MDGTPVNYIQLKSLMVVWASGEVGTAQEVVSVKEHKMKRTKVKREKYK